jgi:hypothetical protein
MNKYIIAVLVAGILGGSALLSGCGNKNDDYASEPVTDYMNLQVGKYILYRLDSTKFVAFGQTDTVTTYLAKDVVEGTITDNLGNTGYRIVRYIRDTASSSEFDWRAILTMQAYPSRGKLETVEGNFRYIKLALPIKDGYSWKGNGYLPANPYVSLFEFSNDEDIQTWDYTYQDMGVSNTYNGKTYDSTISVLQVDNSEGLPITAGLPAARTYWIEKYAKNVGLVYKEVIMWEYQPGSSSSQSYRQGFGLKLTILDHN